MQYSYKILDFDTKLFGYTVAKIERIDYSSEIHATIAHLIDEFVTNDIAYATYRLKTSEFPSIHALEEAGFVTVDTMMAFSLQVSKHDPAQVATISKATENDTDAIVAIAQTVFANTRFYNDPRIERSQADTLYGKWANNSILGTAADQVLVYRDNNTIAGFVTLTKEGHIPLIGVAQDYQGKGIAKALLSGALYELSHQGVREAHIETQITNIPAMRSYSSVGFKMIEAYTTVRWARAISSPR